MRKRLKLLPLDLLSQYLLICICLSTSSSKSKAFFLDVSGLASSFFERPHGGSSRGNVMLPGGPRFHNEQESYRPTVLSKRKLGIPGKSFWNFCTCFWWFCSRFLLKKCIVSSFFQAGGLFHFRLYAFCPYCLFKDIEIDRYPQRVRTSTEIGGMCVIPVISTNLHWSLSRENLVTSL